VAEGHEGVRLEELFLPQKVYSWNEIMPLLRKKVRFCKLECFDAFSIVYAVHLNFQLMGATLSCRQILTSQQTTISVSVPRNGKFHASSAPVTPLNRPDLHLYYTPVILGLVVIDYLISSIHCTGQGAHF